MKETHTLYITVHAGEKLERVGPVSISDSCFMRLLAVLLCFFP
jgi:hypothetical protein